MAKKATPIEELASAPKTAAEAEEERRLAGEELYKKGCVLVQGGAKVVFTSEGPGKVIPDADGELTCDCDDYTGATSIGISPYSCVHIFAVLAGEPKKEVEQVFDNDQLIENVVDEAAAKQEAEALDNLPESTGAPLPEVLEALCAPIPKALIKSRKVNWGKGTVDYIQWTTVPKILNRVVGREAWEFRIKEVQVHGKAVLTTGSLTILGITRENVGVCDIAGGNLDMAIKGSASDCIKRCAVLFGVAMELYEDDEVEVPVADRKVSFEGAVPQPDASPIAKNLGDMISSKQLGLLRAVANHGVDVQGECNRIFKCDPQELSKKAASEFITHIKDLENGGPGTLKGAVEW